jgi:hypothetical protein
LISVVGACSWGGEWGGVSVFRRLVSVPLALAVVLAPVAFAASSCACGSSAAAAATSGYSGGCSSSASGAVKPCSPYAEDSNGFGKIGVQQAGPQKPVAWGVYPKDPAGVFTVTIMVDGQVYDKKTQPYPPHGSSAYDAGNKRYLQSGGGFPLRCGHDLSGLSECS